MTQPGDDPERMAPPAPLVAGSLGILGGTFDPIHHGHLAIAEEAREALGLERVLFVPAAASPFKTSRPVTDAAHRLAMVEAAIEGNPAFACSRLEVDRPGASYTVDTLADLLASRFTSARVTLGNDLRRLRESDWGFYVQDDFRVSSRLTVNLGLRYEYFSPVSERDGLLFNVVSDPFGPFRKQGEPIWEKDLNNFGPRFGLAWDVQGNSKNVIRAGAGVFYSPNTCTTEH